MTTKKPTSIADWSGDWTDEQWARVESDAAALGPRLARADEAAFHASLEDWVAMQVALEQEELPATAPPAQAGAVPMFSKLLQMAHLEEPSFVTESRGEWEIWGATEKKSLSPTVHIGVVAFHSTPSEARLQRLLSDLGDLRASAFSRLVFILCGRNREDQLPVHQALIERLVPRRFQPFVTTLRSWTGELCSARRDAVGAELDADPYFIDPLLRRVDGEQGQASALLEDFLRADSTEGRMGVIIGQGGLGKSTLLAALRNKLVADLGRGVLLVSDDWRNLEARKAPITVTSVVEEAIRRNRLRLSIAQIDPLLANGAIVLLFDSFDEVCSRDPHTSANDVLDRLIAMSRIENSRVRILLTSRPEYWDLVAAHLRDEFEHFELLPFSQAHVHDYLVKRFAESPAARTRAQSLIDALGPNSELPAMPLVLDSLCRAAEGRDEPEVIVEGVSIEVDRRNPLHGIAKAICRREAKKHGFSLDFERQMSLFEDLADEHGIAVPDSEFTEWLGAYGVIGKGAEAFRRHVLLEQTEGALRFRYPEYVEALLADRIARAVLRPNVLDILTRASPLHASASRLIGLRTLDFPGAVLRLANLVRDRLTGGDLERLWEARRAFEGDYCFQSQLFKLLAAISTPRGARLLEARFLPREAGRAVASDFVFNGVLRHFDLRGTVFTNVMFREAEVSSCRFDNLSEFRDCALIDCSIGRECEGLEAHALTLCRPNDETVLKSRRWVRFPPISHQKVVFLSLREVVGRLLKDDGIVNQDEVFLAPASVSVDNLEPLVMAALHRHQIVLGRGDSAHLATKVHRDALKLWNDNEVAGPFKKAMGELVGLAN